MSNIEYVKELCGANRLGWVCEQLAEDLDARDKRIEELQRKYDALVEKLHAKADYWTGVLGYGVAPAQCANELRAVLEGG